ncbi:MAG: FAD-dependent oxidoreductase [bacterium]|nr:FAD-dependent oxidoreductase [bacterium]
MGTDQIFDYAVIGKGLIGSAAARYLSATSDSVALIGPDEPSNWQTHDGVFASHYDEGRITRILDPDPVWAALAKRAIAQYPAIKRESGISFYHNSGGLRVIPDPEPVQAVGHDLDVTFHTHTDEALRQAFPYYRFPEGLTGLFEPEPAGYISPRALVRAQAAVAQQQGAQIIRERATSLQIQTTEVEITTAEGSSYHARKALLAAGAYTSTLLDRKLDLTNRARTILLAELPPDEQDRLKNIPTVIYTMQGHPAFDGIYMLPPIRYPDGKVYLKIGANCPPPQTPQTFEALKAWFHTRGDATEARHLKDILFDIIPGLNAVSFHTQPCVTCYTPTKRPFIDTLKENRLYVAAGGSGSAAKSSDAIGHLAAQLVLTSTWTDSLDRNLFKTSFVT